MKFSKRVLAVLIGLVAIGGIGGATLLTYYGQVVTTIQVGQSVTVTGSLTNDITAYPCETVEGGDVTVENFASIEVPVSITDDSNQAEIETKYISSLTLTKKTVVFGQAPWEIPQGAEQVEIEYTMISDKFTAEIANPEEGYALIYYKDNSDRFNSPAKAIRVEDVSGNLPYADDQNADEYDYCALGEYDTCHGAKIWYVPETAINEDDTLDWSRASEFFFETKLIQYNSAGDITIYPTSSITFYPTFTLSCALEESSEYTITTTVAPNE
jgi:hypothetical protein